LTVTSLSAPHGLFIGNPVQIDHLSWTVTNQGDSPGRSTSWVDRVVLSKDRTYSGDDLLIGLYPRNGALAAGASYSHDETIPLPTDLEGTYYVVVKTDADDQVYEHGLESNNALASVDTLVLLTEPYADLVVKSVAAISPASSGKPLTVTWTVANQGIGITRVGP